METDQSADQPIPHAAVDQTVVPIIAEELTIDKRQIPTGGVRVFKRVLEHEEDVDMTLAKDHVDVRRVLIDREIESIPAIRREGDTTIVPVVEEVLTVEKRLRLKEEIHITRRRELEQHHETLTLKQQEAQVERIDAEGNASSESITLDPSVAPPRKGPYVRQNKIVK